ncbi:MAG: metallophosphoesterase family protein [Candidatus Lernaella stagnicola]|nr:metallophosphoesterase family protein [Candidatus Lernaella stagnicola]
MRVVVISDIHANYDALKAIVKETEALKPDRYVCLGDVVGYYAEPQECVDLVREMDMMCIQGNHDGVAGGGEEPVDFNPVATEAILWTRQALDDDARRWLANLPTQGKITPQIWIVHGSLRDRDEYILSRMAVESNFRLMRSLVEPRVVLFGHTHRRAVYRSVHGGNGIALCGFEDKLDTRDGGRYLINPGGSGQPRDGVPGAPYAIIDEAIIEFRRALYDVEAAAAKVAALSFGEPLADRLVRGM